MQADENLSSEIETDVKEESARFGPVDSVKVIHLLFPFRILIFLDVRRSEWKAIYMFTNIHEVGF